MSTLHQTALAVALPEADAGEARRAPRRRVLKAGRISFQGNFSTFDVMIRDLSDSGAKLKLTQPFIVPQTFELLILNTNTGQTERRPCVKRWQDSIHVGTEFLDTADIAALPN